MRCWSTVRVPSPFVRFTTPYTSFDSLEWVWQREIQAKLLLPWGSRKRSRNRLGDVFYFWWKDFSSRSSSEVVHHSEPPSSVVFPPDPIRLPVPLLQNRCLVWERGRSHDTLEPSSVQKPGYLMMRWCYSNGYGMTKLVSSPNRGQGLGRERSRTLLGGQRQLHRQRPGRDLRHGKSFLRGSSVLQKTVLLYRNYCRCL